MLMHVDVAHLSLRRNKRHSGARTSPGRRPDCRSSLSKRTARRRGTRCNPAAFASCGGGTGGRWHPSPPVIPAGPRRVPPAAIAAQQARAPQGVVLPAAAASARLSDQLRPRRPVAVWELPRSNALLMLYGAPPPPLLPPAARHAPLRPVLASRLRAPVGTRSSSKLRRGRSILIVDVITLIIPPRRGRRRRRRGLERLRRFRAVAAAVLPTPLAT